MNLSLILCSRNDAYMGNSRWRLETTLDYVAERVRAIGRGGDVEVLVTDWGSELPLRDAVRLAPAASDIVSFVTVPPSLARTLQGNSPFPEVLALNAAARRARGRYIGRIDQDTLVGERFLRWFFETVERDRREETLFFSNRRDIPYYVAAGSPSLRSITTFVRWFGARLPVWRENRATGDVFWTSNVGIWLAHRDLWHECGGYDERLIYYNWMETDMICRLRQAYPVVDLGELTRYDFYHLDHVDPRSAVFAKRHAIKNAPVDLTTPPVVLHPNAETWGLREFHLPATPGSLTAGPEDRWNVPFVMPRLVAAFLLHRVISFRTVQQKVWSDRAARARAAVAGRPIARWPGTLWDLWSGRSEARMRRMAGLRLGRARKAGSAVITACGLLELARRIRVRLALAMNRQVRRSEREDRDRFVWFDREYGHVVAQTLTPGTGPSKTALVVSSRCPTIEGELCTIKTLQLSGFTPVVLLEDERRGLRPFYERAGVRDVHIWSEFVTGSSYSSPAAAAVAQCGSVDDLMTYTHAGVRVGMIAVCTALRRLRLGALDLQTPGVGELLGRAVAASISAVAEAERMIAAVRPDLVLTDPEYTPKGELFETCIDRGLDVIACNTAHCSDALMLKRYRAGNRDEHLTTLSSSSWALVRDLEWTHARRDRLADEVISTYTLGDWYHTPWLHPNRHPPDADELRRRLGIDASKKSAFIFPHVLWDAPVMWGRPLFPTYQEWFVETVSAACRNTKVNWIIKIHPDHVWKHGDTGYPGEAAEIRVLREQLGTLPPHITLIPPDTDLSTLSLFSVMDYCITVRGTVGVEAARLGIPVITAGSARYSERGFTVDSASCAEYLAKLAGIEDVPPLSGAQRELAERFAYGLFLLRPLKFTSITWEPSERRGIGSTAHRRARLNIRTEDEWRRAEDLSSLANWFVSRDEDFLAHAE